ncbi:MAG: aspartyl-phosphate phosphatase Spo0E family protein [Peptostreptococcaceae bacterium]
MSRVELLNSKVNLNNLNDPEIIKLSQEADLEIVKQMKGCGYHK